jgi:hypothetical protein
MRVLRAVFLVALLPATALAGGTAESQDRSRVQTYDDLLVRVEERAPGFGGMFLDSDGRLAVYLLDTSQLRTARLAIESVFGSNRIPAAGIKALQGQYGVSQLKAWTSRAGRVLGMPGVTIVDLDEGKNRVTIGIDDRARTRAVEEALSSLGIPRKAVLIEVTSPIRPVKP